MATTPTPKQHVRPPLPPPGPSNIIEISPWPFAPSRRELREHALRVKTVNEQILERERQSSGDCQADTLDE